MPVLSAVQRIDFVSPGSICMFLLDHRMPKPCAMSSSCSRFVQWK
jgi:hypothetical protein